MIKRDSLNLTKLFGKDRSQEDENLQHYFIKTRQYEEIKRGDKERDYEKISVNRILL